ncbi:hypothetical protein [Spirillospora sp. CA-128828]|uniref:hypothetical protein n=1 Tax=Spirillospora sp. CA-128828 TaxID=3240033 RepID=UPI003D94F013
MKLTRPSAQPPVPGISTAPRQRPRRRRCWTARPRLVAVLAAALAVGGIAHTGAGWAASTPPVASAPSPAPSPGLTSSGPSAPGPSSPAPSAAPSSAPSASAPASPQPTPTDICKLLPTQCPFPRQPPPDAKKAICSINPDLCNPPKTSQKLPQKRNGDDEETGSKFTWCDIPPVDSICVLKNIWQFSNGAYNDTTKAIDFTKDPFGYISQALMSGFAWLLGELGQLINNTTQVDWTNPGFLRTYTQMFGLATIVTLFLWLLAVVKRVVAGVPPLEAAGESIGYLLLSVVVTVFMPAAVYSVDQIFELACGAVFSSVPEDMKSITQTVVKAWAVMAALGGGGVFMTMIGSFLLFAIVSVWVELTIRSAMIYLSLAFGPLVFSGLVDKALWGHTKKWIGFTLAILSSKLVTLTVLSLATGMLASINDWSADAKDPLKAISIVLTVLALLFLAFLAPVMISRFIPAFGDEIAAIAAARQDSHGTVRQGGGSDRMQGLADGIERRNDQLSGWKDKIDNFDRGNGEGSQPGRGAASGAGNRTGRPTGGSGGGPGGGVGGAVAGGGDPTTMAIAGGAAKGKDIVDGAARSGASRATGEGVPMSGGGGGADASGPGGSGTDMMPPTLPSPAEPGPQAPGDPPGGAPDPSGTQPPASPPPEPPSDGGDTPMK